MAAKDLLKVCMQNGFLLDKEVLDSFGEMGEGDSKLFVKGIQSLGIDERVLNKSFFVNNSNRLSNLFSGKKIGEILDSFFVRIGHKVQEVIQEDSNEAELEFGKVKVLSSPVFPAKKISVKDFVNHFRSRYEAISQVLQQKDFDDLTSIRKIGNDRNNYTVIVSVIGKRVTKNKNLLIEVEDMTGSSVVLINQNKKELFEKARDILMDEVVAFKVNGSQEILFANDIIYPEVGLPEKKKHNVEEMIAFTSDLHIGSKMFLEKNFLKFIKWVNGEEGDENQRAYAKKIKYLFLVGDSVDGVGIFPGQDKVLNIKDIRRQYDKLAEYLKLIRKDLKIIICPGQHDAVWVGEPQPIIGEYWAKSLHEMENVTLVTNPALIEIDGGFKILMYHGASMHGIIEEIPEIRLNYGHNSPTRVSKEMVKRRHLAPIHGSCDYIPCEKDPLVIRDVPDILLTGDQHRSEISNYNNVLLISSSCWQSITPFEEKVGNNPDPCKVPVFNMMTREIKIIDFSDEDSHKTFEERVAEEIEEKHKEEVEKLKEKMEDKHEK